MEKIKLPSLYSQYYAEASNVWRAHLCGKAPGQRSSYVISQQRRAVSDALSELTGSVIELLASRTESDFKMNL